MTAAAGLDHGADGCPGAVGLAYRQRPGVGGGTGTVENLQVEITERQINHDAFVRAGMLGKLLAGFQDCVIERVISVRTAIWKITARIVRARFPFAPCNLQFVPRRHSGP